MNKIRHKSAEWTFAGFFGLSLFFSAAVALAQDGGRDPNRATSNINGPGMQGMSPNSLMMMQQMQNSLRNQQAANGSGGGGASDADRQRRQQLVSSAANVGMGVVYWNTFLSSCGTLTCHAVWAIPLAVEAVKVADGQKSSARGTGATINDLSGLDYSNWGADGGSGGAGGTIGADGRFPDGFDPTTPAGQKAVDQQLQKLKADLIRAGVTISPDGTKIKTPDGRTFDTEKAKGKEGAAALQAMGMTPQEAGAALAANGQLAALAEDQAKKMAARANAAYKSSLSNDSGGGGVAGGERGPAGSDAAFDPMALFRKQLAAGKGQQKGAKNAVSGLSKRMGEDSIGVAQDNIFDMVTRRYQSRDQSGSFLKD